ncbi:glycosyltransferase [Pseudomonas juntendi]|uniref:glycosyltransferase n=1 Tax=Pseudomonas TaxID=286 RepID=UPI001182A8EF|nr:MULTISPECIES: glycosyltransferase [Pseudomonas]MDH2012954.1 glycosyltransferase [Pseudomonas juntendi]QDR67332.1 glycosyltransferase [Pseudomonas sp. BJP69]
MSEVKTVLPYNSVVDAQWYLATYPDVAASAADPQQHYDLHGAAEGRLPRYLQAYRLDTALWGGFSALALPELAALHAQTDDREEYAYASWTLARWHASAGQWSSALPYIDALAEPLPPYIGGLGPTLLRTEVLLRSGQQAQAQACIRQAIAAQGQQPDLCLAAANVALTSDDPRHDSATSRRLLWLNRALAAVELAPVALRNPNAALSLDNLHASCTAQIAPEAQPKISVIMPAYNAQAFIETALRSLLEQSWSNLEILVVDDCSTDATVERVSALAQEDARIILLQQPVNRGAYAARNTALSHATGTFLVNHDSDDWSHPQRLELMATPLLENPNLVGTLAEWVRADTQLHFQCWRIENSLIEPSVSTIMMRCDAVRVLGGWDEVRVAADHELRQRLQRCHGADALLYVLPGVPLVIARHLPQSLTMASSTHLRSTFYGLRQLYSALAEAWHGMADDAAGLCLPSASGARAFPAPAPMLRNAQAKASYDWLVVSDLSEAARSAKPLRLVLARLQEQGEHIGLLHWPDYQRPSPIDPALLRQAVESKVEMVLAEQQLAASRVLVVGRHLLAYPLDQVPAIEGLQGCQVIDSVREAKSLEIGAPPVAAPLASAPAAEVVSVAVAPPVPQVAIAERPAEKPALPKPAEPVIPALFDEAWYLERNPDLQGASLDAWQHYLAHGHAEGREPGPDFNTAWYLEQCVEARESGMPALLHYHQSGRHTGYDVGNPTFAGDLQQRPGRPTVLLCAHAANVQLFGAERNLLDTLDACAVLHLNVLVSVPSVANPAYIDALRARAMQVVCIPTQLWRADIAPCRVAVERFCALIRNHSVDLVHSNTLMLREPLIAARLAQVPAVLHAHESPAHDADLCAAIGLPADQIVAEAVGRADQVLANSAFTAQHIAKPGATHVVGNIIDLKAFDLPNTLDNKRITAALISSNLPKKGIADLLQLACDTSSDTPNLQLLLIGPHTPGVAALRTLEARGKLPGNLSILPYAASPQAAIAQANIVLNLSHCQETFGRTVLEGMAAGRPVLAYRWGALPELIDEGVTGYTFEHGDTKGMAKRLRQFCLNPKKIRTLGAAGRKRAKKYNLKLLSQQLQSAYESALGASLREAGE